MLVRLSISLGLIALFGAYSLAQSGSAPEEPEPKQGGEVQVASAAPAPAAAGKRVEAGAASDADRKRVEDNVRALLMHFAGFVAESPSSEPAKLDQAIVKASAAGKLAEELADEDKAGDHVHKLRRLGLVPAVAVKVLKADAPKEGDAKTRVFGVATLKDGRHRTFVAGGDADGKILSVDRPMPEELGAREAVEAAFVALLEGRETQVWEAAAQMMRDQRSAEQLKADFEIDLLSTTKLVDGKPAIEWVKSSQIEGGFRVDGRATLTDGTTIPFYGALLDGPDGLALLDIQGTTGFFDRIANGTADTLDITLAVVVVGLLLSFLYILFFYAKGLKGSPRELYILFFTKVTEYSAYGAAQLAFMFYLREDIGMSDIGAGSYYSAWSTGLTLLTMVVGAVCDAIGIKRTLLVGAVALMTARAIMPFTDDIMIATIFGFVPLALGIAITGPVLSVGIKRYTTLEGAALGFGLFYTLMNVGWAVGAAIFDAIRIEMGEMGSLNFMGSELSTYQVILGIGFFINLPDLIAILLMRRGAEMTEVGVRFEKFEARAAGVSAWNAARATVKDAVRSTFKIFGENFVQKAFWVFILLIGITVFARLTFFHFHITWPSYGSRYFGQGSLVGNIFGVLNPVMIVFLVPVFAWFTRRVSSYWMLLVGTIISVGSIFFVVVPVETFAFLEHTWFGTMIFDRWLEVPVGFRDPYYMSMVLFVIVFTIGEAIWSPRLMQFTAEVAPPGREGSYVALAYLPYFGAKFIAGPMAGILLSVYSPEFGIDGEYMNYPDHQMIWWWVGGTAALTPIGLFLLKKLYREAEIRARKVAEEHAAEVAGEHEASKSAASAEAGAEASE